MGKREILKTGKQEAKLKYLLAYFQENKVEEELQQLKFDQAVPPQLPLIN